MQQFFEFTLINSLIDPTLTTVTMSGYKAYPYLDCIFVNRPFYLQFNMKDAFNNDIPYYDISAFTTNI